MIHLCNPNANDAKQKVLENDKILAASLKLGCHTDRLRDINNHWTLGLMKSSLKDWKQQHINTGNVKRKH
jgi:hypothetical protein